MQAPSVLEQVPWIFLALCGCGIGILRIVETGRIRGKALAKDPYFLNWRNVNDSYSLPSLEEPKVNLPQAVAKPKRARKPKASP